MIKCNFYAKTSNIYFLNYQIMKRFSKEDCHFSPIRVCLRVKKINVRKLKTYKFEVIVMIKTYTLRLVLKNALYNKTF